MPNYMFLHPLLGMLAVGLILGAYRLKAGRPRGWRLHYATGLLAAVTALAAFGVALWAVARRAAETGAMNLPPAAGLHLVLASLVVLALAAQMALGLAVRYVLGGPPRFLRYHRANGRVLAGLAIVTFLLGLMTLGTLMG
jgi:hypothetical protein